MALIKFFDLIDFREIIYSAYHQLSRKHKLGHDCMVIGILMLLFIWFNRIWHFDSLLILFYSILIDL